MKRNKNRITVEKIEYSDIWDHVLKRQNINDDTNNSDSNINYFISEVPSPPKCWSLKRQAVSNNIAKLCYDDMVYNFKKTQKSSEELDENQLISNMPA